METNVTNDLEQIDIRRMAQIVFDHILSIAVITLLCGMASFAISNYFVTPNYASSITMYVNNYRGGSIADLESRTLTSDITASQQLVPTYIAMITSDNILQAVADRYNDTTGQLYNIGRLKSMITAQAINNTEILKVTVKMPDAAGAQELANIIASVAPGKIQEFVEKSDVRIIDTAQISTNPVSPNVKLNTILGGLFGMIVSVAFILLRELFDVRVRTGDDLVQRFSYPVLGTIPEIFVSYDSESSANGGDTYEAESKNNGKGA